MEKTDITRTVVGKTGTYEVTYTAVSDTWACTCMAFTYSKQIPQVCKHIIQIQKESDGK